MNPETLDINNPRQDDMPLKLINQKPDLLYVVKQVFYDKSQGIGDIPSEMCKYGRQKAGSTVSTITIVISKTCGVPQNFNESPIIYLFKFDSNKIEWYNNRKIFVCIC